MGTVVLLGFGMRAVARGCRENVTAGTGLCQTIPSLGKLDLSVSSWRRATRTGRPIGRSEPRRRLAELAESRRGFFALGDRQPGKWLRALELGGDEVAGALEHLLSRGISGGDEGDWSRRRRTPAREMDGWPINVARTLPLYVWESWAFAGAPGGSFIRR